MTDQQGINETYTIYPDRDYRRQGRNIVIAMLASVVPRTVMVDPRFLAGGDPLYSWEKVQRALARYPKARNDQMPMHYYTEFISKDYATMVGCPITNKSWYLEDLVHRGALPISYNDAILVVLQENYHNETMDKRLWRHLAHTVLTPLMRLYKLDRRHAVVFLENIINRDVATSLDFPYDVREPTHLGEDDVLIQIQHYEKR